MFSLIAYKAVIATVWFALLFIGERIRPAAPPPHSRKRLINNAALWAIVIAVSPLIVSPVAAWAASDLLWRRPETWLFSPLALAADIIVLDLWTYFLHRAYHRAPILWRLHQIHHRDEFLDTTSAVRFHTAEVIFSGAARIIPIVLIAVPLAHVVAFELALLCMTFFHHSNLRLPPVLEKRLSAVFVTPSIHWVHHHAVTADTNSNYAAIFSLWDRLFATRSPTRRTPEMKIGVEGVEDLGLLSLLLAPFRGARL